MASVIDSNEISHNDQVISNHASYGYEKVLPKTSSQSTITLTSSTNPEVLFEIPTKTYNWHRSYFECTFTPTAGGGGLYNHFRCDNLAAVRTLEVYTNAGVYIVRLNDVHKYTHMLGRHETTPIMAESNDNFGSDGSGFFEGLRTSNALRGDTLRADGSTAYSNYIEPLYYKTGGANAATPVVKFRYKLSNFLYTFMHLDKDMYFPEILNIRIVFNTTNLIMSKSDDGSSVSSNAAAYTGDITLTNVRMIMCKEKNQVIESQLKSQVLSTGLSVKIPFVWNHKFNLSTTSQNVSITIGRHNGERLQRIFASVYHNTETSNNAYNRDNLASAKIVSFYTMVDNERQQISDLVCADVDDYSLLRYYVEGSTIYSYDEWKYNHLWIEDFCNPQSCTDRRKQITHNTILDGKPIDKEIKYEIAYTTANNAHNHYIYVVTLRELSISPTGIFLI